jgi:hypothetical protein
MDYAAIPGATSTIRWAVSSITRFNLIELTISMANSCQSGACEVLSPPQRVLNGWMHAISSMSQNVILRLQVLPQQGNKHRAGSSIYRKVASFLELMRRPTWPSAMSGRRMWKMLSASC